ncbi:hypothetical protein PTKIN_Ptkin14bG0133100 [Pterospermum kingtungense]
MYGKVMDVFISYKYANRKTTFAFVRYKLESEMREAISKGNNRLIDGWKIGVWKAKFGWRDRRLNNGLLSKSTGKLPPNHVEFSKGRDHRSYKDVLVCPSKGVKEVGSSSGSKKEAATNVDAEACLNTGKHKDQSSNSGLASVIGRVKDRVGIEDITKGLERAGFVAQWINLEEVPLHLWDIKFFKSLGDKWGMFLRVDDETASKSRFDRARLLVLVESKMLIPSIVSIKNEDQVFKIIVSLEEDLVTASSESNRSVAIVDRTRVSAWPKEYGKSRGKEDDLVALQLVSSILAKPLNCGDEKCEYSSHLSIDELMGIGGILTFKPLEQSFHLNSVEVDQREADVVGSINNAIVPESPLGSFYPSYSRNDLGSDGPDCQFMNTRPLIPLSKTQMLGFDLKITRSLIL